MKVQEIILSAFTILLAACSGTEQKSQAKSYKETDTGDSVFYYKDFDWYHFRGLQPVKKEELVYPFVKMLFRKDSLLLKVYYSEGQSHTVHFFKLQGKWCSHSSHVTDGDNIHTYLVNMDTAMLEIDLARNLPDTGHIENGTLRTIRWEYADRDTIREFIYKNFFHDPSAGLPEFSSVNFKKAEADCNEMFVSKYFISNDSLNTAYLYFNTQDGKKESTGEWKYIQKPLLHHSIFLTEFISQPDGLADQSLNHQLNNLIKNVQKINE